MVWNAIRSCSSIKHVDVVVRCMTYRLAIRFMTPSSLLLSFCTASLLVIDHLNLTMMIVLQFPTLQTVLFFVHELLRGQRLRLLLHDLSYHLHRLMKLLLVKELLLLLSELLGFLET